MYDYEQRLIAAQKALQNADYILIGAGAGLSAAAGLTYSGERFTDNFADFIVKYGIKDMYAATFYPFQTPAEHWAHWARHIDVNRFSQPATKLYQNLLQLVQKKAYFILTTNVEAQFIKAGFLQETIFAVQGDYAFLQCAVGCHDKLYDNEELIKQMLAKTKECKIPLELIPKCPVCGGEMDINVRHNAFFVQDAKWYKAKERYEQFLSQIADRETVFLDLGVGYNTPSIIRYPFEQMTYQTDKSVLIRVNRDYPMGVKENTSKTIAFNENMQMIVDTLLKRANTVEKQSC